MRTRFFFVLISSLVISNFLGFLLLSFGYLPIVNILGFRFYLPIIVTTLLIAIFGKHLLKIEHIKPYLTFNLLRDFFQIIVIFLVAGLIFFIFPHQFSEPDWMFEFGFSSIVDFPLYFIWNAPQILLLLYILSFLRKDSSGKYLAYIFLPLLNVFHFIASNEILPTLLNSASLLLYTYFFIFHIRKFQSLPSLCIVAFTIPWLIFLLSGIENPTIIKILYASNPVSWNGFMQNSQLNNYFTLICFSALIIVSWSSVQAKNTNDNFF